VEFTDIVRYYLPRPWASLVMVSYHVYLILTLVSYVISSAQVIDFASLDALGGAYGFQLWPELGGVMGVDETSSTPFGPGLIVVPLSFVIVGLVCVPFAVKNLDDNIVLQVVAIVGLTTMSAIWLWFFGTRIAENGRTGLPAVTAAPGDLFSTMLFNFALACTLPSWLNEKKDDVSVGQCLFWSMSYVVIVYSLIGIVGGLAYAPYYETDQTMFSKLNASGSALSRATVLVYPVLQNFTSIPVFAVLVRYNLIQDGVPYLLATFIAVMFPWIMSVFFYTGKGFARISETGGLATSSVVNFVLPIALYCLAGSTWRKASEKKESVNRPWLPLHSISRHTSASTASSDP